MRAILTISVPEEEKKKIEERAKKAGKTISGYILYTVKLEEKLITEDEILAMAEEAEKDYRTGKTKELKNPADLIKRSG